MSIIHEALKKTEVSRTLSGAGDKFPFHRKWILYFFLFLLAFATSYFLVKRVNFNSLTGVLHAKKVPDKHALPVVKVHLSLNGIFISDKYKMAMINNHMYQKGDKVEGMEIASIKYNQVKLINGKQVIILKNT